ncbi:MAG: MarR family transcriptional regulator [Candidatus Methanofastidiosia archaeon]
MKKMNHLTKSAKRVIEILTSKGELSQKEIIRESGLTERTVRYILNTLDEMNLLRIKRVKRDKRLKVYSLSLSFDLLA